MCVYILTFRRFYITINYNKISKARKGEKMKDSKELELLRLKILYKKAKKKNCLCVAEDSISPEKRKLIFCCVGVRRLEQRRTKG